MYMQSIPKSLVFKHNTIMKESHLQKYILKTFWITPLCPKWLNNYLDYFGTTSNSQIENNNWWVKVKPWTDAKTRVDNSFYSINFRECINLLRPECESSRSDWRRKMKPFDDFLPATKVTHLLFGIWNSVCIYTNS